MKINLTLGIAALAAFSMFTACKNSSSGDFDTDTASGIQYHFFKHDDKGTKPSMGDYAKVYLTLKGANDSLIFDSRNKKRKEDTSLTVNIHLVKTFNGCLPEGIAMMAVGDSASFRINADSFYLKSFHSHEIPPYVKPGSVLTFNVKLESFETPQQMTDNTNARIKEREEMRAKRKADEQTDIAKYIADNKISAKPESDGIYILERTKGKGKKVKEGDSVEVKYSATLLNGTVVESSDHGAERGTFMLVYGKDHFIKGFDDIITNLENGGSVIALIPSELAYGGQSQGLIQPYTPLIYTVEIIKVK